jgi:tRNA pseudouridine38-40 synthase
MGTIKLTLEYDGTAYAGWQRQLNQPTIQAKIEEAIVKIAQQKIPVVAAGRTDAGVHALGQVVSFQSNKSLPISKWPLAMNNYLPDDITVLSCERVPDDFHARYSAKEKIYEYRICMQTSRPAIDRYRVWHFPYALDTQAIQQAMAAFSGSHDFTSFRGSRSDTANPVCTLSHIALHTEFPYLTIRMQANRFLKQMVRAIVGTLTEVGQHKRAPETMQNILEAQDRRAAGKTAPPQGLYLVQVLY